MEMLTDESINLAHNMLKDQFPGFTGLMDTVLGQANSFDIFSRQKPFIKILYNGSHNWLCVANIKPNRESNNEVLVFDSMNSRCINSTIVTQLSSICYTKSKHIHVKVKGVQQQSWFWSFCYCFCHHSGLWWRPVNDHVNKSRLRSNLIECLETGKMCTFPKASNKEKHIRCKNKVKTLHLLQLQLQNALSKRWV